MRFHLFGLAHIPVMWDRCCCPFTTLIFNMAKMIRAAGHELVLYGAAGTNIDCDEFVEIVGENTLRTQYRPNEPGAIKWRWTQRKDEPVWKEHTARGREELARRFRGGDVALITFGNFQTFIPKEAETAAEIICGYSGVFHERKVFPSYSWMHYLYGEMKMETKPEWMDMVIPHYLDPTDFAWKKEKDDYLLFLGRLNPVKGPDIACDIARATGLPLVIAGRSEGGEDRPGWLKQKAKGHDIRLIGAVDHEERNRWLAGAKALLCPARWLEAFGMTTIEAFACGTPVISSDWGAFTETVDHGVTGFRCRDMEQFVTAVDRLDEIDPADCRLRAETNYSLDVTWPRYETYFRRILKVRHPVGWYLIPYRPTMPACRKGVIQIEVTGHARVMPFLNALAAAAEDLGLDVERWESGHFPAEVGEWVVVWNGLDPWYDDTLPRARAVGARILYAEHGWLPQEGYYQLDTQGINGQASWARDPLPDVGGRPVVVGHGPLLAILQHDKDSSIVRMSPQFPNMTAFLEHLEATWDGEIVVRPHPRHPPTGATTRLVKRSSKMRRSGGVSLKEDFARCGAVATINSTCGAEAIEAGMPLLCYGDAVYRHPGVVWLGDMTDEPLDRAKQQAMIARLRARQYTPEQALEALVRCELSSPTSATPRTSATEAAVR